MGITCRELPEKDPRSRVVDLHEVQDIRSVDNFGEYCWDTLFEKISSLVLSCPFCSKTAPIPTLTDVLSVKPLTLLQDLICGNCGQRFHVMNGQAIKLEVGNVNEQVAGESDQNS
jgi:hypothetical protein